MILPARTPILCAVSTAALRTRLIIALCTLSATIDCCVKFWAHHYGSFPTGLRASVVWAHGLWLGYPL